MGEHLLAKAAHELVDNSQGDMVLHTACLSQGAHALVMPAQSGSVKTTLTAWLASRGYGCLCLDVVFIPQSLARVAPLCRTMQLKGESPAPCGPTLTGCGRRINC